MKQDFGHKSGAAEYCRGFHDQHGQWNNGFYCPKWAGPDQSYCCGPDDERVCCPQPPVDEVTATLGKDHLTLPTGHVIAIVTSLVVLLAASLLAVCCLCRCCVLYQRRKRTSSQGSSSRDRTDNRALSTLVNYASCPGQSPPYSEVAAYPLDDPPPYPGHELSYSDEDKQQPGPSGYIHGARSVTNPARPSQGDTTRSDNGDLSLAPFFNHSGENTTPHSRRHPGQQGCGGRSGNRSVGQPEGCVRGRTPANPNECVSLTTSTHSGRSTREHAEEGPSVPRSPSARNTPHHTYVVIATGKGQYSVEV